MRKEYDILNEKAVSIKCALEQERRMGGMLTQMAGFWQECEVSKPNKCFPVPVALLDDLFKLIPTTTSNPKNIDKEALILDLTSLLSTAESTATSYRSSEAN